MKLRNKKTGEVVQNFDGFTTFTNDWSSAKNLQYTSLTKLNEEWEDYTPAEPLIKSNRERGLVRTLGGPDTMVRWDKVYDCEGWGACAFWRSDEYMGLGSRSKELILPGCFVDEEEAGGIFAEHTIKEWCGEEEE